MAVDESTLPFVMPASVPRVTADGRPTQHLINWEEGTRNWYFTNAVATDKRITEVKVETDSALASFSEDINAVVTAQGALVEKVDTVEAKADNATASGKIYFAAKAAPGGATAAFGLYLTAGNAYAGMEIIAKSGGGSAIAFAANSFMLRDSGTAQQVFNYSGGLFTFNVPVRVGTNDIGLQAVNAPSAAVGASDVTLGPSSGGWVTLLSVTATGGSGQVAVVHADFKYYVSQSTSQFIGSYQLIRSDGLVLATDTLLPTSSGFPDRIFIQRLDPSFSSTFTYRLQIQHSFFSATGDETVTYTSNRGLMVDLRKR